VHQVETGDGVLLVLPGRGGLTDKRFSAGVVDVGLKPAGEPGLDDQPLGDGDVHPCLGQPGADLGHRGRKRCRQRSENGIGLLEFIRRGGELKVAE
jgi:hypothetical protein